MMAALVDEDMEHGFNCTFMELKCCERGRVVCHSQVLIVPLWN